MSAGPALISPPGIVRLLEGNVLPTEDPGIDMLLEASPGCLRSLSSNEDSLPAKIDWKWCGLHAIHRIVARFLVHCAHVCIMFAILCLPSL